MVSFVWDGETRCKNIKRIALRAICTTFVMHLFLPLKCVGGVVLSDSLQCTDEAEFVICLHLKKSERDHYIVFIPEYDPRDRKKYGKH